MNIYQFNTISVGMGLSRTHPHTIFCLDVWQLNALFLISGLLGMPLLHRWQLLRAELHLQIFLWLFNIKSIQNFFISEYKITLVDFCFPTLIYKIRKFCWYLMGLLLSVKCFLHPSRFIVKLLFRKISDATL